jgi:hypothetical protein
MSSCVRKVVDALDTGDDPDIRERLLEATLLIEKFTGSGDYRRVSPAVDSAEVMAQSIAELRTALINFARSRPEHPDVGSAIWALGKFRDDSLREFFLTELHRHWQARRFHPTSQADCALGDLGDGVDFDFAPGAVDYEGYFVAVRDYLRKHPVLPQS